MRKTLCTFVLLAVAFALVFPDAAMAFGLCECCKPAAHEIASMNEHCGHSASAHDAPANTGVALRGMTTLHVPCECGIAGLSNSALSVSAQNQFTMDSSPAMMQEYDTRFPVSYGLANRERGPPA